MKLPFTLFLLLMLSATGLPTLSLAGHTASPPPTYTESIPTTQVSATRSYAYPPYQVAPDNDVQVRYYSKDADRVVMDVLNVQTGKTYAYPLQRTSRHNWEGAIPSVVFTRNQELKITFTPTANDGLLLDGQVITVSYDTLDTADYYRQTALSDSKVRILPFQKAADTSPSFNVYWPGLFYTRKPPYPVAARVSSSNSPQNSVRKLDPIPGKPGWFQFQVPTLWYTPGEDMTVDFTSTEAQAFDPHSDYPLSSRSEFIPQATIRFKTLTLDQENSQPTH